MNLKPRFHLLTILLFLISAVPAWLAVRAVTESVVEQWAVRYAEKQVLYDKGRALQPILREAALARQLANSQKLRAWARLPESEATERWAFEELESFRRSFADQSYFVALRHNGKYFHSNAENHSAGYRLRYVLDPLTRRDAWFFDLVKQDRDIHINVNQDLALGFTRLWINAPIRDGQEVLGIVGTSFDLTSFIENVVEEDSPGVTSLFIDHHGAIQLHRNQSLIDFSSISKSSHEQKTVALLFDRALDRKMIYAAMDDLASLNKTVSTVFVTIKDKRHLAGIAYLPEIGWYEITLLDLDVILPLSQFSNIFLVSALSLISALFLFNLALNRFIIKPLAALNHAMSLVEAGADTPGQLALVGSGEIRGLMQRFSRMAHTVFTARHELEYKVLERTAALERLSKTDPLSELFNRRGMTEHIERELERGAREMTSLGILWLDVDLFKEINDRCGHAVGDRVLKAVAGVILETIRPYDLASRWGGDEFIVMIHPTDQAGLDCMGERLRQSIAAGRQVLDDSGRVVEIRSSIGGHLSPPGESLEQLLQHGDMALYAAKAAGRNCYRASANLQAGPDGPACTL